MFSLTALKIKSSPNLLCLHRDLHQIKSSLMHQIVSYRMIKSIKPLLVQWEPTYLQVKMCHNESVHAIKVQ